MLGTGPAVILPPGKEVFTLAEIRQLPDKNMAAGDVLGAFAIASHLQRMGRLCQLRPGTHLTLEEMQSRPVIAIGFFDNPWSTQLNRDVRFVFQLHQTPQLLEYSMADRQQPPRRWRVVVTDPLFPWKLDLDYAIVTRLIETTTRQVFISVVGSLSSESKPLANFWQLHLIGRNWPRRRLHTGPGRTFRSYSK